MIRRFAGYPIAVGAGLALWFFVVLPAAPVLAMKMRGTPLHCPWEKVLTMSLDQTRYKRLVSEVEKTLSAQEQDVSLDLQAIRSPHRSFWQKRPNAGVHGLAQLMAEQKWFAETNPDNIVRSGDIVVDCGANVGVFVDFALQRGAGKVIAIEPVPVNVECLRRNFAAEIASGKVVVVAKGVWNEAKMIELFLGTSHATGSMVRPDGDGGRISVPVDTLDRIVQEMGLPRVDFIKMDIEGAERQALMGAQRTLTTHRPRLMLDSYHLPDDMEVLPRIIRQAHRDYALTCGPCASNPNTSHTMLVPHVTFYN